MNTNMATCSVPRSDSQLILGIEKCMVGGHSLLLDNCSEKLDCMLLPAINHANQTLGNQHHNGGLEILSQDLLSIMIQ